VAAVFAERQSWCLYGYLLSLSLYLTDLMQLDLISSFCYHGCVSVTRVPLTRSGAYSIFSVDLDLSYVIVLDSTILKVYELYRSCEMA
jgi:hypothetical protein